MAYKNYKFKTQEFKGKIKIFYGCQTYRHKIP